MNRKSLKYILIVNSEPDIADLFAEMLLMDEKKYVINTAHTGKDCLLTLKRDKPDIILLDTELPDMDGWDLINKIKEREPHTPIVIITAKPPAMYDFSHFSMISDYLIRPVTIDCLHLAIRDALEIPVILDKCIETIKSAKGKDMNLLENNILLLKQSINDRKLLILMMQIYPSIKLINSPDVRSMIDTLKIRIERAQCELETFKKDCLLA
jgi:DNA-binding response OmpR family regulator